MQQLSRYQVMTNINHLTAGLLPPYSPGAVYREIQLMHTNNLIVFDQSDQILPSPAGTTLLHYELLEIPLPDSIPALLTRILATLMLSDTVKKATAIRKLQIEMIKTNHFDPEFEPSMAANNMSPKNEIMVLSQDLRRTILSFVARF